MKIPAMIAAELRRLTSTKMSVIALIALMCVPLLYGGLYLWANQNPYGKFSELPVALVVDDAGAQTPDTTGTATTTTTTNYGARLADQLIAGKAFDWQRMSAHGATAALRDGSVDFVVSIPTDFSAALTSVGGASPHRAQIALETNDANNYLASSIGAQAAEKIRASVAQLVGEEAASRLLLAISDIRGNLVTAADGAAQLADGTTRALDGATQVANGAAQLQTGTQSLASGAHQVAAGASTLAASVPQLAAGAQQVANGDRTLAGYADQAGTAMQQISDSLPAARAAIAAQLQQQGLDQTQIDAVLARLDPLAADVQNGNTTVQRAVGQIDALASGAAQVADGARRLNAGAAALNSGATQVAAGADAAASGAAQLSSGAASLSDGLGALQTGAAQLRDGLRSGVAQIPASSAALRAAQAKAISDPVSVSASKAAAAGDYGSGLAPFFAALAGWIGIYALFLIVKPISRRAVTALRSPLRVTLAGWLTPAVLGGIQMVALLGVLALVLGFGFANPLGALGVLVLASFTYAAIILALNVWFGSVGQFLGLVLMVLQLVTAGGTFPWQTLPAPLAALHHVLPMGYVVDAMRQVMYGGEAGRAGTDILILLCWMLGALALAALGVTRMTHRRTLRDLQPSLIG
jgi:putative membrane protein